MTAQLGLGTIGIGRPCPTEQHDVPSSAQVAVLLERAVSSGVRFFDTDPAHGLSEVRLGQVQHEKLASTAPERACSSPVRPEPAQNLRRQIG